MSASQGGTNTNTEPWGSFDDNIIQVTIIIIIIIITLIQLLEYTHYLLLIKLSVSLALVFIS